MTPTCFFVRCRWPWWLVGLQLAINRQLRHSGLDFFYDPPSTLSPSLLWYVFDTVIDLWLWKYRSGRSGPGSVFGNARESGLWLLLLTTIRNWFFNGLVSSPGKCTIWLLDRLSRLFSYGVDKMLWRRDVIAVILVQKHLSQQSAALQFLSFFFLDLSLCLGKRGGYSGVIL